MEPIIGVCIDKRCGSFRASISVDGKPKHLGYFKNVEDANKARLEAEKIKKQNKIDNRYDKIFDSFAKIAMRYKDKLDNGKSVDITVSYKTIGKEEARKKLMEKIDKIYGL